MGIRVWLDDIRLMPIGFDYWAKTAEELLVMLVYDEISEISFDHDLGEGLTGYDVAKTIEEMASNGTINPMTWNIHSANPVGRRNIEMAMKSAERFWISEKRQ